MGESVKARRAAPFSTVRKLRIVHRRPRVQAREPQETNRRERPMLRPTRDVRYASRRSDQNTVVGPRVLGEEYATLMRAGMRQGVMGARSVRAAAHGEGE
jgi:hypothetical protein